MWPEPEDVVQEPTVHLWQQRARLQSRTLEPRHVDVLIAGGGTCCPSPSRASGGNACCYKQSPCCRLMVSDSTRWLGGLSGSGYRRRAERTALLRVKMAAKADRESWMSFEYLSSTSASRHVIIHKVTPFSPSSLNTMSIATTERRRASKR
jgi:hypothetical protein